MALEDLTWAGGCSGSKSIVNDDDHTGPKLYAATGAPTADW